MSEEAKCNCQHCEGTIAFPLEMDGQTVTCPHCQTETLLLNPPVATPPASEPQPQDKHSTLFKLFDSRLSKKIQLGDANFIVTLKPGDVRYLWVCEFIQYEVDAWIAYFKHLSLTPEIRGPYVGEKEGLVPVIPEAFIKKIITWDDRFRILHGFAKLHCELGVPSTVYKCFHNLLALHSLEFSECINSWIKEAWDDFFIARSYENSDQHILIKIGDVVSDRETVRFAVFKKTPFVVQRLEELRKLEEAERTAENLESLRRSNFKIFVYLMEDLRNGLVKIGQSQTPEKRENTLQSEVPEISLRFYLPAHDTAEKELHEKFDAKRVRGEWFQLTPQDILAVIGFLKQKGDASRAFADYEWLGKITLGS